MYKDLIRQIFLKAAPEIPENIHPGAAMMGFSLDAHVSVHCSCSVQGLAIRV